MSHVRLRRHILSFDEQEGHLHLRPSVTLPMRVVGQGGGAAGQVMEKTTVGVVFIPMHFAEAAANLLTNDALDPQALIPEFRACAV